MGRKYREPPPFETTTDKVIAICICVVIALFVIAQIAMHRAWRF
jgi:hypothetical protein